MIGYSKILNGLQAIVLGYDFRGIMVSVQILTRPLHAAMVPNTTDYIEALPLAYNAIIGQDGQDLNRGLRNSFCQQ